MKSRYDGLGIYNKTASDGTIRPCMALRFLNRETPDESRIHIVSMNENLIDISWNYYGDETLWYLIAEANPSISDPFELPVGMELIVPVI